MPQLQLTSDRLGDLFAAHGDALVGYFMRKTFDAETSFDLTAETFAEAVGSRHRFRGDVEEQAVAWLYGIARNQHSGYVRRGYIERRALRKLGLERPPLNADEISRIERDAELDALRDVVAASMAELPAHHRDAVQLRVVEERSYAETASELCISEQTARAHVSRGLRRLADIIPAGVLANLKEGLS